MNVEAHRAFSLAIGKSINKVVNANVFYISLDL